MCFFSVVFYSQCCRLKMNPNILQNKFAYIHFLACAHKHTYTESESGIRTSTSIVHSQVATKQLQSCYVICELKPRRRKWEHMCNIFRLFASSRSCINVRITIDNTYIYISSFFCATNLLLPTILVYASARPRLLLLLLLCCG